MFEGPGIGIAEVGGQICPDDWAKGNFLATEGTESTEEVRGSWWRVNECHAVAVLANGCDACGIGFWAFVRRAPATSVRIEGIGLCYDSFMTL